MDTKIQLTNSEYTKPDFGRIFRELAAKENISAEQQKQLFSRKEWNNLDVIQANEQLFRRQSKENLAFNQKHKAYDEESIKEILEYQRKHKLNNAEITRMFKLSRNTIAKWHKVFSKGKQEKLITEKNQEI